VYNTGEKTTGSLVSGGSQVQAGATSPTSSSGWYVTYASTNGGSSSASTYQGDAYAITAAAVSSSGYTSNTATAEWIVAPGASTSASQTTGSGYVNLGGNNLPGNGTGNNEGIYVYTLAFTISGSGAAGTKVTSAMSIVMTLAADDGYTVYVNPSGQGVDPTGAPSKYSASAAATATQGEWSGTATLTLGNSGANNNSIFYIGTNYISVVVDNTNAISGPSSQTTWNESGFLAYQTEGFIGADEVLANGEVVPEVSPWIPLAGALAAYAFLALRRGSLRRGTAAALSPTPPGGDPRGDASAQTGSSHAS
jgi:hypothetical protein